jgi:hypothetical protein
MSYRTEEENKFEAKLFAFTGLLDLGISSSLTIGAVYENNVATISAEGDFDGNTCRVEISERNIDHHTQNPDEVAIRLMAKQAEYWSRLKLY